jgi:hypothetical protein
MKECGSEAEVEWKRSEALTKEKLLEKELVWL